MREASYHAHAHGPPGYGWPSPPYRSMPQQPSDLPAYLRKPNPAKPFRPLELVALLALVIGIDLALWHEGPAGGGFGLAIFFAVLPIAILVARKKRHFTPRVVVIGVLAALVAIRCAYEATPSVVLSGLALVGALALALRRRRLFIPDILGSIFASIGRIPSRLGAAWRGVKALIARTRVGHVSFLPILVPMALIGAFLGVFALANPVVASGLRAVFAAVASVISLPSPLRVFFWMSAITGSAVLLRPGLWTARGQEAASTEGEAATTSVQIARNALVGLNALFLAFIGLDAKFLIVGATPAGMTTQEYAHQGAFWLTVALLMLTAVIGFFFRGALAHDASAAATRVRTLAYMWMGQGLVLALATFRRIGIHITHSGLSDLRIVGILGTTLVVSGVLLVALKLKKQKTFTWLVRRQLDAFALTAIVYSLTSTHALGASVNVQRVEHGEYRPLLHAFAQSRHVESVTTYLPLLHHHDQRVREGVAALLQEERAQLRLELELQTSWRSRDLASRHALAQLEAADIDGALGNASASEAKVVLMKIAHVANDDCSLEEILSIPVAPRAPLVGMSRRGEY
ncbi:MAG: DUF4153 domain-containing protein [Labilithrix sp.]